MNDPGNSEAFIINPEASEDAICNAIHERLAQAHSMTFVMAGEEQDFQRWNDKIQADYYWTLQRMIGEIRRLYDHQTQ